jgi:uncharacterized protein YndB with AHSA1/START domain
MGVRILAALLVLLAIPAEAKVTHASAAGFVIEDERLLAAPPAQAWQALTADVGRWWNAEHSYSGNSSNFTMDPNAGGCFCEQLAGGGSVEHLRVYFADPPRSLRLAGGLGPLAEVAGTGKMTFELEAREGGTLLRFRYVVGGYLPDGLAGWAAAVDGVLLDQLTRLEAYVANAAQ